MSREDAARLLELDYRDRMAIGALVRHGRRTRRSSGVSRYARIDGTDQAECAIVVADAWQGRGVGTELMRSLAQAARANGIRTLVGSSLAREPADPRLGAALRLRRAHRAQLGRPRQASRVDLGSLPS